MKKIVMTKVDSSMIKSVGYDKESKSLYVEFKNKTVYCYEEVPEDVFLMLIATKNSIGAYFVSSVKTKYKFHVEQTFVDSLGFITPIEREKTKIPEGHLITAEMISKVKSDIEFLNLLPNNPIFCDTIQTYDKVMSFCEQLSIAAYGIRNQLKITV